MAGTTIRTIFKEPTGKVRRFLLPRSRLGELLDVERSRVHQLLAGAPLPGHVLARFTGHVLIPVYGETKAAKIILASLRDWYPSAFPAATASDSATATEAA